MSFTNWREEEVFEPIIKHSLEVEETIDLIPTTNYIRNFNVFYEEVIAEEIAEEDFIIIDSKKSLKDIEVIDPEELAGKIDEKEQIALRFDMPLTDEVEEENENVITFSLDEDINDIDVSEHIEVIPVLEYNKEGETRYSLDDYMELENKLTGAKSKAEEFDPKLIEDELVFERKTVAGKEEVETKRRGPHEYSN